MRTARTKAGLLAPLRKLAGKVPRSLRLADGGKAEVHRALILLGDLRASGLLALAGLQHARPGLVDEQRLAFRTHDLGECIAAASPKLAGFKSRVRALAIRRGLHNGFDGDHIAARLRDGGVVDGTLLGGERRGYDNGNQ